MDKLDQARIAWRASGLDDGLGLFQCFPGFDGPTGKELDPGFAAQGHGEGLEVVGFSKDGGGQGDTPPSPFVVTVDRKLHGVLGQQETLGPTIAGTTGEFEAGGHIHCVHHLGRERSRPAWSGRSLVDEAGGAYMPDK